MKRTLLVMRHAQAEFAAVSDLARPLSDYGRQQAQTARDFITSQGFQIDHALVSPAQRTQQTFTELDLGILPQVDTSLYDGGATSYLEVISTIPEQRNTAILVGHLPTVHDLVTHLTAPKLSDLTAIKTVNQQGFNTATIAVIEFGNQTWNLKPSSGNLIVFHPVTKE
ncbi:MAG: SixA phosphatase family protein [Propionibacteriaceae bacterium]